ncbi:MAG: TrkA C-terminal domain-containing protein [Sphaerochaetaceae bacterium]
MSSVTTKKKRDGLPIYARIAIDIAYRIVNDEIPIGKKLSGRSLMSSEYGVSPETIRRSMALLEELQVVEVQENRGVFAISKENAQRYLERHGSRDENRTLLIRMQELIVKKEQIDRELFTIMRQLVHYGERFAASNPFYTYESIVGDNSNAVGKSLSELAFWQKTQATVIAVRRSGTINLSPSPDFKLEPLDVLILVGDQETRVKVETLIH